MSLKHSIIASAALLSGIAGLHAEDTYLTVELNSGSRYNFLLADKPVVTFSSEDLVINGSAETSYSIDGVRNFHFTEGSLSESENHARDAVSIISADESTIQVKGIDYGSLVYTMNVSGAIISAVKADSEGSASVSLPQAKGVYILSTEGRAFKIIRK